MHKNQNILSFWGSGFFIRLYSWNYNIIAFLPPFSLLLNLFFMRYSMIMLKFIASYFDCSTVQLQNTADSQNAEDRWSCGLFWCLFYCGKGPCWEEKRWLVVRNRLQWSGCNNQNACHTWRNKYKEKKYLNSKEICFLSTQQSILLHV